MRKTNDQRDSRHFVFHEAQSPAELETLLQLRHRVYCDSRWERFVRDNRHGLDLDVWDLHARHFGLFQVSRDIQHPVGYLRVVEDTVDVVSPDVYTVASTYPDLIKRILETAPCPFPLMKYFPEPDQVESLLNDIRSEGERMVEAGRLALLPSANTRHLGKHIAECALAVYFMGKRAEHAMWCCASTHTAFYRRYGLTAFNDGDGFDIHGTEVTTRCLYGRADGVPERVRLRLQRMSDEFVATGSISYSKPFPVNSTAARPHAGINSAGA